MPGGRLTARDRTHIAAGLADRLAYADIARRLGRPTSTISREVARNGGPDGYQADQAQQATTRRAHRRTPAASSALSVGSSAHGRDPAAVRAFAEQFATLMAETGVPRMAARVLVCLVTTDAGSLTAAELTGYLRVSPAAVSKAIGYLEGLELVRRERDSGRRRERYIVDDDVWLRAWTVSARTNARWAQAAAQGVAVLGAATPAGVRVGELSQFFAQLSTDMVGGNGILGDATSVDDGLIVLAALVHAKGALTVEQLARGLGWATHRVVRALQEAEQHPHITDPITVVAAAGGAYTVAARPDRLTTTQRQALSHPVAARAPE